jgi:hypothetical protein
MSTGGRGQGLEGWGSGGRYVGPGSREPDCYQEEPINDSELVSAAFAWSKLCLRLWCASLPLGLAVEEATEKQQVGDRVESTFEGRTVFPP